MLLALTGANGFVGRATTTSGGSFMQRSFVIGYCLTG